MSADVPAESPRPTFPTWRTLKLGVYRSVGAFLEAFTTGGFKVSESTRRMLERVAISDQEVEVELIAVTAEELGLHRGAGRKEIYDRALSCGLSLCRAEVGLGVRLEYSEQPDGECLMIAMEPIAVPDGLWDVFTVEHNDEGRWLHSRTYPPDTPWRPSRWLFFWEKQ